MKFERRLQLKVTLGYMVILIVGIGMIVILLYERKQTSKIETETPKYDKYAATLTPLIATSPSLPPSVRVLSVGRKPTVPVTMPSVCVPTACCKP